MSAPLFIQPNQAKYALLPANYVALVKALRVNHDVTKLAIGTSGLEGTLTVQGVDFSWIYDGAAELLVTIAAVHSWLARGIGNEAIFGHLNTQLISLAK